MKNLIFVAIASVNITACNIQSGADLTTGNSDPNQEGTLTENPAVVTDSNTPFLFDATKASEFEKSTRTFCVTQKRDSYRSEIEQYSTIEIQRNKLYRDGWDDIEKVIIANSGDGEWLADSIVEDLASQGFSAENRKNAKDTDLNSRSGLPDFTVSAKYICPGAGHFCGNAVTIRNWSGYSFRGFCQ